AVEKKAGSADDEDGPGGMMRMQPQMGGMMGGRGMMGNMMGGGMGGMMGMGGMGRNPMPAAQREFQNRVLIAPLSAARAASDKSAKSQAVMARLEQPLAMSFANPTPLADVLKYIKSSTSGTGGSSIPIYVDPRGLEQNGATVSSPVTIDLDGVPLKMSLRLMLKQLGLAYCVRDGVLIISSVEGVREELAEAASEMLGSDPKRLEGIMRSMGCGGAAGWGGCAGMGGSLDQREPLGGGRGIAAWRHGQIDNEGGPLAQAGLDRDTPAVLADDLLRDRQAQAGPAGALRRGEDLED